MARLAKGRRRLLRTIALGLFALGAICFALYAFLDRTAYEVLLLAGAGVIGVAVLAGAGALAGYLMYLFRR